jgi:thioredoxin-related protein
LNVRKYLKDFILIKLNTSANRERARSFGVKGIPSLFVVDSEGKQVGSIVGYRDAEKFLKAMKDIMED